MHKNFTSKKMTVESMICAVTCGSCECSCTCGTSTGLASRASESAAQDALAKHIDLLATGSIFG